MGSSAQVSRWAAANPTPDQPGPVVGAVGVVGVLAVLGGGLWWLVCCRRVAYLERKLAALHAHYGGALPHVIRCIDRECPNTPGQIRTGHRQAGRPSRERGRGAGPTSPAG